MAGLLQIQLHAGTRTTTKLIFTTKTKCYPTCSHINTQPNLQINHGGDENLPALRLKPSRRVTSPQMQREGRQFAARVSLQMPGSRAMFACASLSQVEWQLKPPQRGSTPRHRGAWHGHPAEHQKWGVLCQESWGAHERGSSCCGSAGNMRLQTPLLQCKYNSSPVLSSGA